MSRITIYLEGGGDTKNTKSALRRGMDAFLDPVKRKAREKSWHWRLVACGGRNATYQRFRDAVADARPDEIAVLLVDAEAGVGNSTPHEHLHTRDNWDLAFASSETVHLMVQVMETWIIADTDSLAGYYGQGFRANALPATDQLETVKKDMIIGGLHQATRMTQKGPYHKIRHADLLRHIDHRKVRQRCPACDGFFSTLETRITTEA